MRYTPDNITELAENEVFCFGSNLSGKHGKGAALQAYRHFGAEYGVGEGLTGRCYAFPTLDYNLNQRTDAELTESIVKLIDTANANPELVFLLTKVGCGLAGYPEQYMHSLFYEMPLNIVKPEGW